MGGLSFLCCIAIRPNGVSLKHGSVTISMPRMRCAYRRALQSPTCSAENRIPSQAVGAKENPPMNINLGWLENWYALGGVRLLQV
jgi:hypothetical protein